MSANQDAPYKKEMDTLTQYFEKAKDNQTLLIQIGEDPIGTLQAMGIAVEDKFNEPVKMQLQTASGKTANQATAREAERMSAEVRKIKDTVPAAPAAPTGLRIVQEAVPPNVPNALEFLLKPWGLVLVVREPAINYLQGGGVISAGVLSGVGGVASAMGPFGVLVGVILAICAAALSIYAGIIQITDKGKGVYLTWTWAQLIPGLPQYGLPVVTAV